MERTRSKLGRFCNWHSFVNYTKYKCARDGIFFTLSYSVKSWDQPTVVDFMNRLTDRDLFGVNTQTTWLTNSDCMAQALSTSNYQVPKGRVTAKLVARGNPGTPGILQDSGTPLPTVCQTIMKAMSQQLQSNLCAAAAKDQPQRRPLLPKLDILAVDPDEELQEEWEAEDDVKGGPLDPHEVKIVRQKKIQYL